MTKRKYRIILIYALIATLLLLGILYYFNIYKRIPSEIRLLVNKEESFNFGIPAEAELIPEIVAASERKHTNIPEGELRLDFSSDSSVTARQTGKYTADVKLFGLFKIKSIDVSVIDTPEIVAGGSTLGLIVETDGVMVLGTGKVSDNSGNEFEPSRNILKSGDYIEKINDIEVSQKEKLVAEIQRCNGDSVSLYVRRGDNHINVLVIPVLSTDGEYKIGAWIRDDTQGIGTITYITTTGDFGALGHGITDVDTGLIIEVGNGEAYPADVIAITKGVSGTPGELSGVIHKSNDRIVGKISKNTNQGIFGTISDDYPVACGKLGMEKNKIVEVAMKQDIKPGKAVILSSAGGETEEYEIEIEKIDYSNENHSKGMVIHITDKRLINLTGGIVQGMSGSPILQNGKLAGAVTHVFVRDATRGYGIFIENMLEEK